MFLSLAILNLDSADTISYEDEAAHLDTTASMLRDQGYELLASYHSLVFQSCLHDAPRSMKAVQLARTLYQPLFIRYGFKLCLEFHVHRFKLPVNGVVYIGDGSLGTSKADCPESKRISEE